MKELKLNLIESDTTKERIKFRKGLHYYPRSGVFLSRTDQIHICEYQIRFPEEAKESFGPVAYMRVLNLARCEIVAPFKMWLSQSNTEGITEFSIYPPTSEQLCSKCGTVEDFLKAI